MGILNILLFVVIVMAIIYVYTRFVQPRLGG